MNWIVDRKSSGSVGIAVAVLVLLSLLVACAGRANPTPTVAPVPAATASPGQVISLGDIDPDEPIKKLRRFQPLADYLADRLKPLGIQDVRVVIARDIEEMARFLAEGTVDVYFDSPLPTLAAQEISGSEVILRRWKGGDAEYWSTYIALRGNGIDGVEDFVGKVIALDEPHSTSGYILPAGTLIDRGYRLSVLDSPESDVAPDEIGYFFSLDDENTMELVVQGRVAGGGLSNQDYRELPMDTKEKLVAFDRTISVPRQLVSVRPGLDPELVDNVRTLLIELDQTEEGRVVLEGLKNTRKFDPLPTESAEALGKLKELINLVSE